MRTGKIKVIIDMAEHEKMDALFAEVGKNLGDILDIRRETLAVGDYILKAEGQEEIVFTFKEVTDFRNSFFNGHLAEEIYNIYLEKPEAVKALIIARDEDKRVPQEIHIWVNEHWKKRNFVIPTFKFDSRQKAVEFMISCALTVENLEWIDRRVKRPDDYSQIVGLYSFYGVGPDKATALAERFPKPIDLFNAMEQDRDFKETKRRIPSTTKQFWKESRWWWGILGETMALRLEEFILDGKEMPKRTRGEKDGTNGSG